MYVITEYATTAQRAHRIFPSDEGNIEKQKLNRAALLQYGAVMNGIQSRKIAYAKVRGVSSRSQNGLPSKQQRISDHLQRTTLVLPLATRLSRGKCPWRPVRQKTSMRELSSSRLGVELFAGYRVEGKVLPLLGRTRSRPKSIRLSSRVSQWLSSLHINLPGGQPQGSAAS